ncbi:MAG TPA: cell division protein FtsA [Candidatus Binatia bacterium]|jgi:cell division protein FtsA|nr:cell division protein FtsA [Candidatus Binatia bacterium]
MGKRNPLVVGLDVGTYKIGVVVAEVGDGGVEITGIGTHASTGLKKGTVVNIDATVEAIRKAVEEAELMAGCEIRSVVAGSAGSHTKGFNSHGVVAVKNREVAPGDVERVMEAARAVALPMDREVLHVLPQEFVVDDQDGVKDPVGMAGVRLEARVHIVTGAISSGQNLVKCCNRAGLHVQDVLGSPLAAAEAVLTPEERELGVALIEIGAGTTSLVVFHQNAIHHTAVLPVGGGHVTNDLAAALRTPFADAERLKQRNGAALALTASSDCTVEVAGIGGRPPHKLSPRALAEVIEPRAEEILALVRSELERAGCEGVLTSGVVLTGGGSVLSGITDLAERVFRTPVRVGTPLHLHGLVDGVASPMYSTAVGLVLHGLKQRGHTDSDIDWPVMSSLLRARHRVASWIRDFF